MGEGEILESEWLWEVKNSDINNPKFSFVKVGSDNHFELFIWWHYTLRWDKLNMKPV